MSRLRCLQACRRSEVLQARAGQLGGQAALPGPLDLCRVLVHRKGYKRSVWDAVRQPPVRSSGEGAVVGRLHPECGSRSDEALH